MNKPLARFLATTFFLTSGLSAKYDPSLSFQTIKTENFYIHFHQRQEARARVFAELAERKHALLTGRIGHTAFFRTHLVLSDTYDIPNGFASFEPWNRVEMFAARPLPDSVIGYYQDWDDLVFTHEYTHTLTIEQIYGLPGLSRYILGRVWFPNANQPAWIIEGSAVAEESSGGFGRNNSSIVEMYFRGDVEGQDLKSINRASVPVRDWPAGNVHYLYGGRFIAWLKKKYPDKNFNAIHRENADNIWPYLNNTNAVDVFGEKFTVLWDEWLAELDKEQRAVLRRIEAEGLTPLTRLTDPDFYQLYPRFENAQNIYYLKNNNYERASLQRISLAGKTVSRKEKSLNAPVFLTMHGGKPYVLDAENYRSFSLHTEVYDMQAEEKITERARAVSLDVTRAGDLLMVTQNAGLFSLALHDGAGRIKELLAGPTQAAISHARLSPSGDSVVFTARPIGTATNHLYLLSTGSGNLTRLTQDSCTDLHPAFSPDGKKIAFSSDRSGIFNLYEIDLNRREISRLTNLTGGAFYPDYSPDGKAIALSEFTFPGYRIALYDRHTAPVEKKKLRFEKVALAELAPAAAETVATGAKPYSIFPSILPSSWSPEFSYYSGHGVNSLGFSLYGIDALGRDFAGISFSQNLPGEVSSVYLAYENSRYYPDFYIAPYVQAGKGCEGICSAGGYGGLIIPFLKYYTRHYGYVSGSYSYDRLWKEQETYGRLGYGFSNTQFFSRSVSPENGRSLGVSANSRRLRRFSSGDFPEYSYTDLYSAVSYAEYLPGFFRNNVVMARAVWVHSWDIGERIWGWRFGTTYGYASALRLRGYNATYSGQGLVMGTLEYRFPIYQPDWGFFRVPFFFRDFYGKLFFEAGQAYRPALADSPAAQKSAGAEIGLANIFGYRYMWSAYIGYARGFDVGGEHQVYFGILGFTGVLWSKYSPHEEYH